METFQKSIESADLRSQIESSIDFARRQAMPIDSYKEIELAKDELVRRFLSHEIDQEELIREQSRFPDTLPGELEFRTISEFSLVLQILEEQGVATRKILDQVRAHENAHMVEHLSHGEDDHRIREQSNSVYKIIILKKPDGGYAYQPLVTHEWHEVDDETLRDSTKKSVAAPGDDLSDSDKRKLSLE